MMSKSDPRCADAFCTSLIVSWPRAVALPSPPDVSLSKEELIGAAARVWT